MGDSLVRGRATQREALCAADGSWAIGRVHLGVDQAEPQLHPGRELQVLFRGTLENEDELRATVQGEVGDGAAELVGALYRQAGPACASMLDGSFSAMIVDAAARQVVAITDRTGSYFLYWYRDAERLVVASEVKAVLQVTGEREIEPQAVGDYLTFGFPLGQKTLARGIQLLPAASTLVYSWEDGRCRETHYWSASEAYEGWQGSKAQWLDALSDTFNRAVVKSLSPSTRSGISLSGGLDSRTILGAIDTGKYPLHSYTLGVKGCADQVIAARLAQLAGTRHTFFELDQSYLQGFLEHLRQMVGLTDGMYLSHGLTEMLALEFLETAEFDVLLRGHGGELAKMSLGWPLHTDARICGMSGKDEFAEYLLGRVNYIGGGLAYHELFADGMAQAIEDAARNSLREAIGDVPLQPPDLCSYLYLTEHHRRFTTSSLEIFRGLFEIRMPFASFEFLRTLLGGRSQWRDDTTVHRTLIERNRKDLLRVRNSNTGAPGNSGPRTEWVLDKVNTIFKRLNVYGYRHYHNFEDWMKRMLIQSVEEVLLDEQTLARGVYREAGLRRLIQETREGKADWAYLLQVLLVIELWARS